MADRRQSNPIAQASLPENGVAQRQQTIAGPAMCAGVGVHSGALVRVVLSPAPVDTGIVFARADARGEGRRSDEHCVRAHADFVSTTQLGTTLRNSAGFEIATVEHLLAACAGLGIDNLIVDVEGPELPILDGSSAPFVQVLLNAGVKMQYAPRRRIRLIEPVEVRMGVKSAAFLPAEEFDGLDMDVTIRFADPAIGVQRRRAQLTAETFLTDIAQARTFGFLADVSRLHALGLGRGASMDNAIVLDGGKVVNPEGLRFEDEFVRHKMLDAVGDISLAGAAIIGRFVADQPGHALNAHLVRALLDTPEAWVWEPAEVEAVASEPAFAAVG
jgi:UDP-3-O-[3-hydroxymyristoyl] N-acetylglucosamine deacetylase